MSQPVRVDGDGRDRLARGPRGGAGGFTLVELAIGIAIVGLLLSAFLPPLATRHEARRYQATRAQMREVNEALAGFAVANHNRLPCPDTDGDGREDRAGPAPASCIESEGFVPWAALGVDGLDAWGRPLRYVAEANYTGERGVPYPPDTSCCLAVQDRAGNILVGEAAGRGDNGPAAIVFSCGKNGMPDGENDNDRLVNPSAECTNPGTFDGVYVQGPYTEGVFDDVLIWLSRNVLLSRLVAGESWPP